MPALFGLGMGITLTVPSSKRVHYSGSLGLVPSLCMCTFIISVLFSLNKEFQNSIFSNHSSIHRLTNSDLLGDSGRVVNSLDLCPASLKSLGCFYFRCVLSSQWKALTVNLRILYCQH